MVDSTMECLQNCEIPNTSQQAANHPSMQTIPLTLLQNDIEMLKTMNILTFYLCDECRRKQMQSDIFDYDGNSFNICISLCKKCIVSNIFSNCYKPFT